MPYDSFMRGAKPAATGDPIKRPPVVQNGERPFAEGSGWHPFLGAHMSIAGGLHHALEDAARHRCGAVQLFTRNSNQWKAKPLEAASIAQYLETDARLGPFASAAHDSYLINLASPDATLRARSRRAFIDEVERCESLRIPRLVFHPGAHMGEGEAAGLKRVAEGMRETLRATAGFRARILVESTAGQGSGLGHRLEHLAELIDRCGGDSRVGVCLDTCHLFAAGYDFRTPEAYAALRAELARRIGLDRIGWFHLNDCVKDLGCRVDRHAHIGRGRIGSKPFGFFLRDPAFRGAPMVLETPKENDADRRNLALLRRLSRLTPGGPEPRMDTSD
jgi:deoxyribonuclease IV